MTKTPEEWAEYFNRLVSSVKKVEFTPPRGYPTHGMWTVELSCGHEVTASFGFEDLGLEEINGRHFNHLYAKKAEASLQEALNCALEGCPNCESKGKVKR